MTRLALINPNTSLATTEAMLAIAREAGPGIVVEGFTARFGAPLILDEAALGRAALAVEDLAADVADHDGVVVAAFGDPGLAALRRRLARPVTGIAEAGMREAASGRRRFAVATTTPELVGAIARAAQGHGDGELFLGTFLTSGAPMDTMADPDRLAAALGDACARAVRAGAEAVVVGGGPLARAARALRGSVGAELIEPVPAAIRLALARMENAR
ncbi:aspartate/glutamate racemase family protein [Aurantimonas sp. Leaf443]|uniref:aspartate/glutamate racemase family protein n=1 Tax=Aurantimonas sp. Leaf443 TaxID=1736378 RepID=UPI0006F63C89|nr:aspartate/glutamate racemase family protein [Aurantimonas sp. Leaf443]KQT84163.1 hydrogenase expression protein HupH [Aurantimonas sp. Leaf443]